MNFCTQCGSRVRFLVPEADDLPRYVCVECGHIHYTNPRLVVGCIPEWEERVLLCRRAIEPRRGRWTLPAGFMENGETTRQAAVRETREEACARVELLEAFTMVSVPHINQVHLMYRARLTTPAFDAGPESLEVALFSEPEIPWEELSFPSVLLTLRHYFRDRRAGRFRFRSVDVYRPE